LALLLVGVMTGAPEAHRGAATVHRNAMAVVVAEATGPDKIVHEKIVHEATVPAVAGIDHVVEIGLQNNAMDVSQGSFTRGTASSQAGLPVPPLSRSSKAALQRVLWA